MASYHDFFPISQDRRNPRMTDGSTGLDVENTNQVMQQNLYTSIVVRDQNLCFQSRTSELVKTKVSNGWALLGFSRILYYAAVLACLRRALYLTESRLPTAIMHINYIHLQIRFSIDRRTLHQDIQDLGKVNNAIAYPGRSFIIPTYLVITLLDFLTPL